MTKVTALRTRTGGVARDADLTGRNEGRVEPLTEGQHREGDPAAADQYRATEGGEEEQERQAMTATPRAR